MRLSQYLVAFSIITVLFLFVLSCIAFGSFNNKVLKKSVIESRIFFYVMSLTAGLYIFSCIYVYKISVFSSINMVVLCVAFVIYAISVMITLLVTFKPLTKINKNAKEIAKGKKNLEFNFEGALEYESLSDSLNAVQQNYQQSDRKLNLKENLYQKFVPKEYLKYFGKSKLSDVDVGDNVQVKLCTMFCDMRNSFYSSETLSLIDNFELIKDFINEITKIIQNHNGFVDKYMGDGVISIFEDEDDALKAANEIAKQIDYKNIVTIGKESITCGISLNSGMCIVGVVGEYKQKQFVIISDVVNLCSRVEQLNKIFHTRVLMTKQFMSNLKENYNCKYVGTIEFDDLTGKVPLFESLDAYDDGKKALFKKTLQEFETGVRLYEKGDYAKARDYFLLCIKQNDEDMLSSLYLSKTKQNMSTQLTFKEKSS